MLISDILTASAIALLILLCFKLMAELAAKRQLNNQLQGLQSAQMLKNLLIQIQKHRGMMSAYLKGDNDFKSRIKAIRSDINHDMAIFVKTMDKASSFHQPVSDVEKNWRDIEKSADSFSINESFKKHSHLIQAILTLMNSIAEQSQLYKSNSYDLEYVKIIWSLLPMVAESVGKARAVGGGISASGCAMAVDKVNVQFLTHKISGAIAQVKEGLDKAGAQEQHLLEQFNKVEKTLDKFVESLHSQYVYEDAPMANAAAFFDEATEKLSCVFEIYETSEQMAAKRINCALKKTENKLKINYAFALFSILLIPIAANLV